MALENRLSISNVENLGQNYGEKKVNSRKSGTCQIEIQKGRLILRLEFTSPNAIFRRSSDARRRHGAEAKNARRHEYNTLFSTSLPR